MWILRKITSLGESLAESHAYDPIRNSRQDSWRDSLAQKVSPKVSPRVSESPGKTLCETWRQRVLPSLAENVLSDHSRRDSPRLVFLRGTRLLAKLRAKESCRESRIGPYAWLSARLSQRLVFLRGNLRLLSRGIDFLQIFLKLCLFIILCFLNTCAKFQNYWPSKIRENYN